MLLKKSTFSPNSKWDTFKTMHRIMGTKNNDEEEAGRYQNHVYYIY